MKKLLVLLAFNLMLVTTVYAADFREVDYTASKSVYPENLANGQVVFFQTGSLKVLRGDKVKFKMLLPPGINIMNFVITSNTLKYGTTFGLAEDALGDSPATYGYYNDATTPSLEQVVYFYVDNIKGTADFTLGVQSGLYLRAVDNAEYITWCDGLCKSDGGNTTQQSVTTAPTKPTQPTASTPPPSSSNTTTNTTTNSCAGLSGSSYTFCLLGSLTAGASSGSNSTAATTTETTTIEPEGPIASQKYTTGKNSVIERLLIIALGDKEKKLDGLTITGDIMEFVISGQKIIAVIDSIDDIPENFDNINEDSVNLGTVRVKKLFGPIVLTLNFDEGSAERTIKLTPIANNELQLVEYFEGLDGVFKAAVTKDGWIIVILENGVTLSLYFDLLHNTHTNKATGVQYLNPSELPQYDTNDINGDGQDDIVIIQNGVAQLIYIKVH